MKSDLLDDISDELRKRMHAEDQADWMEPMLAKLTDKRFSDDNWIFERRLDGERCLAFIMGTKVQFFSRNKKSLNTSYPEVVEALSDQRVGQAIADGEIVAFEGSQTSFPRLQKRMHVKEKEEARNSGVTIYYYLFDLMYLDGFNICKLPLRQRKSLLKKLFEFDDPLRLTVHRNGDGEARFKEACRKGWEGIIAKRADSEYVHGRSAHWLKFKCVNQEEFVVAGFTDPQGERSGFGALLIAFYENGILKYAGKVGTGYDDDTLASLRKKLKRLERMTSPFGEDNGNRNNVHWVRPELVAQIGFTEWTKDRKLRHPRFLGLRRGKNPKNVVKNI